MKKYRIVVGQVREKDDKSYDTFDTIYEQHVDSLDLQAVIRAVNQVNVGAVDNSKFGNVIPQ